MRKVVAQPLLLGAHEMRLLGVMGADVDDGATGIFGYAPLDQLFDEFLP